MAIEQKKIQDFLGDCRFQQSPFYLNHMGAFQFFHESIVQLNDWFSQKQSQQQGGNQEESQHTHFLPVVISIKSCYTFPHGVHAVRKRKQRINLPAPPEWGKYRRFQPPA